MHTNMHIYICIHTSICSNEVKAWTLFTSVYGHTCACLYAYRWDSIKKVCNVRIRMHIACAVLNLKNIKHVYACICNRYANICKVETQLLVICIQSF